jgi:hypothetical protein
MRPFYGVRQNENPTRGWEHQGCDHCGCDHCGSGQINIWGRRGAAVTALALMASAVARRTARIAMKADVMAILVMGLLLGLLQLALWPVRLST